MARKTKHSLESVKYKEKNKLKRVLLYPYLTNCFVGTTEINGWTIGVYDEGCVLKSFRSEGMNIIDAEHLLNNHKSNKRKGAPIFIKTGYS
tara:strand:- start:369 stop:641 length:273 start_codon:yes stop_codon:yes gene_type:complete